MAALPQAKKQYFLLLNGNQQYGPVLGDEIRKWKMEGSVTGETLLWAEGMPDWAPLQALAEFSTPPLPQTKLPSAPKPPTSRTVAASRVAPTSSRPPQRSEIFGNIALAVPLCSGLAMIFYPSSLDAIFQIGTILGTAFLISFEASAFGAGGASDVKENGNPRDGAKAWSFAVIFLWGIGFPLWFHRRASIYGAQKKLGTALLAVAIFLTGSALSAAPSLRDSLFSSQDVLTVKHGHFLACPSRTIEQAVNGFFGSPKWESGVSASGQRFVNISGQMTYMQKPVQGVLQFTVDGNILTPGALELNGVPQMELIKLAVIGKMCGNI